MGVQGTFPGCSAWPDVDQPTLDRLVCAVIPHMPLPADWAQTLARGELWLRPGLLSLRVPPKWRERRPAAGTAAEPEVPLYGLACPHHCGGALQVRGKPVKVAGQWPAL
eukprot:13951925-Alexandrium_andersonii.AAC.1